MKRFWLFPIIPVLCLLAASPAWSDDSDEDGQTLAAKPGMARVYLIEGFVVDGPLSRDSMTAGRPDFYFPQKAPQRDANGVMVVPGGPMAVGAAAGMAIAALLSSPREKPDSFTHVKRYLGQARYYLGDRKIGLTREGEYIAVDLAPGHYDITFNDNTVAPLSLAEGEVVYLLADLHFDIGLILEVCHTDCGEYVRKDHRVSAFPKTGSNIPNF